MGGSHQGSPPNLNDIYMRQKLCIVIYVAENYIITTDTISGSLPATQEKYTFGVMKNID